MKVLHLPGSVAGNAFGLAQGERSLGLDSKALSIEKSVFQFPSDLVIHTGRNPISKIYHRINTFFQIRKHYDVYHFNFGASLFHFLDYGLNLLDLPFYKSDALKVVTYQGCDARQKYPTIQRIQNQEKGNAACFYNACWDGICNSGQRDKRRREAIDKMMTYCEHAFALNPDLLYFLPKGKASFLPYTVPNFDLIPKKKVPFFLNDRINILHAPTQRVTKGTQFILDAISKLQEKFPNKVNFILVENVTYKDALEMYLKADLVIDQMLVGWYGGLAVEVMKMGIPVASYINEEDLHMIPNNFSKELPIIRISIENIFDVLSSLVKNRESLLEYGTQAKMFVEKWHHPNYVASITKKKYLDLTKPR